MTKRIPYEQWKLIQSINDEEKEQRRLLDELYTKNKLKEIEKLKSIKSTKRIKKNIVHHKRIYTYDINNNNKDGFTPFSHKIQIQKAQKDNGKNNLYIHQVKFIDSDNKEISGLIPLNENNRYYDEAENITSININSKKKFFIRNKLTDNRWRSIRYTYCLGSDLLWIVKIWIENDPNNKVIISTKVYDKIKYDEKDEKQIYRDDIDGTCFYNGIYSYFEEKADKNKNAKSILNKLKKNETKYKKSYTIEEIKLFCEEFKISIVIKDYITGNDQVINKDKFNRFSINFINTKYNHLDKIFNNNENIQYVNKEKMEELKKIEPFYIDMFGSLITTNKTYKLEKDEFQQLYCAWCEKYNINKLYINESAEVNKILDTYDFNIHRWFNEYSKNEDDYKEIDLKKAYFNYSNIDYNKFYIGVPSGSFINFSCDDNFNIDIVKKQINNKLIGYYQVIIKSYKIKNIEFYKLGFILNSKHTLFSPMILLLSEYINFEFVNCSIAPAVHIPFDDEFLNKDKKTNTKHYVKACGLLNSNASDCHITIKPLDADKQFYKTFYKSNYNVFYDENENLFFVNINQDSRNYKHIGYAIHAYTTILILNDLLKMDLNKVLGVKVDSIVLNKDYNYNFDKKIYGDKSAKLKLMFENDNGEDKDILSGPYKMETLDDLKFDKIFTPNGEYITSRILFYGGMGGTGKTHSILISNIPKKNICFTSRSWDLIQNKQSEYNGILGLSIQKLTGISNDTKCEKYIDNSIKYIVQDEMTLSDKIETDFIIKDYYYNFIFLLGDINEDGTPMQCCIDDDKIYKPNENTQYIKFTKTYRFEEELNKRLLELRKYMEDNKGKGMELLKLKFKKIFKDRIFNVNEIKFGDDDVGISYKDDVKIKNELTNIFIKNGAKPQYFIKTTNIYKNELRGRRIENPEQTKNHEMKLFKTVHSFQGRELNKDQNIIICIKGHYYDYQLLYTAVSRAKRLDQIYLFDKY